MNYLVTDDVTVFYKKEMNTFYGKFISIGTNSMDLSTSKWKPNIAIKWKLNGSTWLSWSIRFKIDRFQAKWNQNTLLFRFQMLKCLELNCPNDWNVLNVNVQFANLFIRYSVRFHLFLGMPWTTFNCRLSSWQNSIECGLNSN